MKKVLFVFILFTVMGPLAASESNSDLAGTSWEVVSQNPSATMLTINALQSLGLWEEGDEDDVVVPSGLLFTITSDQLIWQSETPDGIGILQMSYHRANNQLVIDGPNHLDPQEFAEQFYPQYYNVEFSGDELVLTTDNMPIFGSEVIYHLVPMTP